MANRAIVSYLVALFAGLVGSSTARGGISLQGDYLRLHMQNGHFNWSAVAGGAQFRPSAAGAFVDFTYPGAPVAGFTLGYTSAGGAQQYTSEQLLEEFTAVSELDQSAGTTRKATWTLSTPEALVTRTIEFRFDQRHAIITNRVLNQSAATLTGARWYEFADADMDVTTFVTTLTHNGTAALLAPTPDFAESIGPGSFWSMGFGTPVATLGHDVSFSRDVNVPLVDYGGLSTDANMGAQIALPDIPPGYVAQSKVMVAFGDTLAGARNEYLAFGAQVTAPNLLLPGDFDEDFDVDGNDFLLWQRGQSPISLSQSDLTDWEANYGEEYALSAAVTAAPEPAAWILLASSAVASAARRQRRAVR